MRHPKLLPRHKTTPAVIYPKVSHIDVLRKFVYRLDTDMPQADRIRLQSVIATYQRLYVK